MSMEATGALQAELKSLSNMSFKFIATELHCEFTFFEMHIRGFSEQMWAARLVYVTWLFLMCKRRG